MRVRLLLASALLACVVAPPALADGSFRSSDPELDAIWSGSVKTAQDMLAPGPIAADWIGRPCRIDLPVVILDGVVRDRSRTWATRP